MILTKLRKENFRFSREKVFELFFYFVEMIFQNFSNGFRTHSFENPTDPSVLELKEKVFFRWTKVFRFSTNDEKLMRYSQHWSKNPIVNAFVVKFCNEFVVFFPFDRGNVKRLDERKKRNGFVDRWKTTLFHDTHISSSSRQNSLESQFCTCRFPSAENLFTFLKPSRNKSPVRLVKREDASSESESNRTDRRIRKFFTEEKTAEFFWRRNFPNELGKFHQTFTITDGSNLLTQIDVRRSKIKDFSVFLRKDFSLNRQKNIFLTEWFLTCPSFWHKIGE